ncbi:hypothetical protein ACP4OV_003155 [Aristida adscensionis]
MQVQKKALAQMIVMFCEAVRFKLILEEIKRMITEARTSPLPLLMWSWITNWSTLSRFALDCYKREKRGDLNDNHNLLESIADLQWV